MFKQLAKKGLRYLLPELFQMRAEIKKLDNIKTEIRDIAYSLLMTEAQTLEGKVGSSTIFSTLSSHNIDAFQTHGLTSQFWGKSVKHDGRHWYQEICYAKFESARYRYLLKKVDIDPTNFRSLR